VDVLVATLNLEISLREFAPYLAQTSLDGAQ
jgi:hypothetical protein